MRRQREAAERRRKEREAEKLRKFKAAKENLLKEIGAGQEEFGIKEASGDTDELGLMDLDSGADSGGGGGGGGLELMSLDEPKPTLRHKTGSSCGAAAREVSRTLKAYVAEAKTAGYRFAYEDVRDTILSDDAVKNTTAAQAKAQYDETQAEIERMERMRKDLLRLKSCLNTKGCSLINLAGEFNKEIGERIHGKVKDWITKQLPDGIQKAKARVDKAQGFLAGYVKRLVAANKKLISKAAKC